MIMNIFLLFSCCIQNRQRPILSLFYFFYNFPSCGELQGKQSCSSKNEFFCNFPAQSTHTLLHLSSFSLKEEQQITIERRWVRTQIYTTPEPSFPNLTLHSLDFCHSNVSQLRCKQQSNHKVGPTYQTAYFGFLRQHIIVLFVDVMVA